MGRLKPRPGVAGSALLTGALVIGLAFRTDPLPAQVATGFLDRTVRIGTTEYAYQVYVPRSYDGAQPMPVILFLHGAGERGTDGLLQTEVGIGTAIRQDPDRYPAIIVMPQVPPDSTWQGSPGDAAMAALDRTLEEFNTDRSRVYLTGMSMGGNGTWYLAYRHPDRFAALAAICGFVSGSRFAGSFVEPGPGSEFDRIAERIRDIPVYMVHGTADNVVRVSESRAMNEALTRAGATVRFVEMPGIGHNSWDPAYQSVELTEWLFRQRR